MDSCIPHKNSMEISLSKFYKNEARSTSKLELNFPLMMDHDSGYISHNPESNSDSSMEHPVETVINTCLRPIYLSEDALLEKPEVVMENTNKQIEKDDDKKCMNVIDSPELIPSSVVSQITDYSGFDNESDEEVSIEIPTAKQILLDISEDCSRPKGFPFSNMDELVGTNNQNKMSDHTGMLIFPKDQDDKVESNPVNPPLKTVENYGFCTLNNITNMSLLPFNENETKKRLTLIFSKCDKENVYSVKRKYQSLSPDDGTVPNNFINDVEESKISEITVVHSVQDDNNLEDKSNKYQINNGKEDTENNFLTQKTMSRHPHIGKDNVSKVTNIHEVQDVNWGNNRYNINSEENINFVIEDIISEEVNENKPKEENIYKAEDVEYENTFTKNNVNNLEHIKNRFITEKIDSKDNMVAICIERSSTVSLSTTPEKKYKNSVDPNISPDLFDEEETVIERKNKAEEKYIMKRDLKLLKSVQNSIKGVLPPLSMTVLQMSINEMLNRLESNKDYFWSNSYSTNDAKDRSADSLNDSSENGTVRQPTSLLISGNLEDCINKSWPKILEERYHGLHHNRSKISEQFEELCGKYGQRYVGAETQSSCTVFETNSVSPVKRKLLKQRWPVKSPGRRLSHLAKRRITFSSSSLQAGTSSVASSRARQILVDARKLDLLNRRKSPRKTPRKSPRVKSRTPSSSAKKKLAMRFRALAGEIEKTGTSSNSQMLSSKRALFRSPDRDKSSTLFLPSTSGISTFKNDLKNPNTKRALFISPSKNSPIKKSPFKRSPFRRLELGGEKKRKRNEGDDLHPSKLSKTTMLEIRPTESEIKSKFGKATNNEMKSEMPLNRSFGMQSGELSAIHKKKLQWAVYEALRSQNISPTHAQFKTFASVLARVTRRLLPNLTGAHRPEGSTSERMLRVARHHVFAVVRGKPADEIVNDYLVSRSRNGKPQGYVGIEEFKEKNKETSNKENTVRGRVNTIESLEKKKLEQLGGESKIERIRKVINFGDDNR